MDKHILEELKEMMEIKDLPESMQPVAELIGIDNLMKLSNYAGGYEIYIPVEEALVRNVRNKRILDEYTGYNGKELALKYGITERMIYSILRDYDPTQYNIFDVFDEDGKMKLLK